MSPPVIIMSQTRAPRSHLPLSCKSHARYRSPSPSPRRSIPQRPLRLPKIVSGYCRRGGGGGMDSAMQVPVSCDIASPLSSQRQRHSCVFPRSRSVSSSTSSRPERSSLSPVSVRSLGVESRKLVGYEVLPARAKSGSSEFRTRASICRLPVSPGYRRTSNSTTNDSSSSGVFRFPNVPLARLYQPGLKPLMSRLRDAKQQDVVSGSGHLPMSYQVDPCLLAPTEGPCPNGAHTEPATSYICDRGSLNTNCGSGVEGSITRALLTSPELLTLPAEGVMVAAVENGGDGEYSGICEELPRLDTRWRLPGSSTGSISSFSAGHSNSSSESCKFTLDSHHQQQQQQKQQQEPRNEVNTVAAANCGDMSNTVCCSQNQQQDEVCEDNGDESYRTMGFQITSVTKSRLDSVGDDDEEQQRLNDETTQIIDTNPLLIAPNPSSSDYIPVVIPSSSHPQQNQESLQEQEQDPGWQGRFKVINLRTGVPYWHGRWQCVDYLDACPQTLLPPGGDCAELSLSSHQHQLSSINADNTILQRLTESSNDIIGSVTNSETPQYQPLSPTTKQQQQPSPTTNRTVRSVDTITTTTTTAANASATVTDGAVTPVVSQNVPVCHWRQRSAPVLSTTGRTRSVDAINTSDRVGAQDGGAAIQPIDNKIEQAMDLVKSHLLLAVREEVDVLNANISQLVERIGRLERENNQLRSCVSPDVLAKLDVPHSRNPTGARRGQ